ncbi:hypothetical protein ACJJTC_001315, partial [Scirpophaga incertulas]
MNMGILHAPVNIPINIQYGNGNDEPENFLNPNDIRIMNAIANVEAIAADNLRLARAVSEAEARIAANNANAEAPPANAEPQPVVAEPRRIISVGPLPSPYRRVNYVDSAVPRGERYTEEVRRPNRGRAANRARAGDAAEPFMSSCSTRDIIAVSSNTAGPSNAPSISNTAGPSNVAEMSSTAGPSTSAGVSNPPGPSNVAEPQKLAKRTNEQPQINANAEPQKCEASKKPSNPAPKKRAPAPPEPGRELAFYAALQRHQHDEQRRRELDAARVAQGTKKRAPAPPEPGRELAFYAALQRHQHDEQRRRELDAARVAQGLAPLFIVTERQKQERMRKINSERDERER